MDIASLVKNKSNVGLKDLDSLDTARMLYYNAVAEAAIAEKDIDTLTGLPKRETMENDFADAYSRFTRSGVPFAFAIVDIDHFKSVNDNYGHLAGDEVLKEFSKRLKNGVRDIDGVYRYGGEEFGVLYSGVNSGQGVLALDGLREKVSASKFNTGAEELDITFSGGVYSVREGDSLPLVINKADKALYQAKKSGRNRVALA